MAVNDAEGYKPATLNEQAEAAASNLTTLRAAVAAHLSGAPWDWIAERYRYSSATTARIAVEKFIGETFGPSDLVAARNKARARYERLLQGQWFDATHPFEVDAEGRPTETRNEAHFAAVDRARGLVGDLTRLDGLNAPTQLQVYVPGAEEMMEVVASLRAARMQGIAAEADIWVVDGEDEDENGDENGGS